MTGDEVWNLLAGYRYTFATERELQDEIEEVLERGKVEFTREHRLDGASRPDFLVDRVAVEVKVKGDPRSVARQVRRYLAHADVDEVVLVTAISRHALIRVPGRVYVVSLALQGL